MSLMLAALFLIVGAVLILYFAADPYSFTILKTLHVIAIVVWVGGDITLTTLGIVFERRRDQGALAELGKMGGWIGTRIYTPALFAVFILGAALIEKGKDLHMNYGWGTFWITAAIVGWGIASCVGVGFVGPELGRIDKTAREFGPESPEMARRVKRLFMIFRFDTALLILITLLMVAKPTF